MTTDKTCEQLISEVMDLVTRVACEAITYGELGEIDHLDAMYRAEDAVEARLCEILNEYSKDSERLMFACEFDGFTTVEEDRYDYAIDCMEENGRDEPNKEDELNGLRRLIDAAMEVEK